MAIASVTKTLGLSAVEPSGTETAASLAAPLLWSVVKSSPVYSLIFVGARTRAAAARFKNSTAASGPVPAAGPGAVPVAKVPGAASARTAIESCAVLEHADKGHPSTACIPVLGC